jgi:hypothetical protein
MFHKADLLTAVNRKKKSARVANTNIAEEDDANKIRIVAKKSSMKGVRPQWRSTVDFKFLTVGFQLPPWVSPLESMSLCCQANSEYVYTNTY